MQWGKYLTITLYVVLLVAAGLCFWSFLRADLYRVQTDEIMSQTFEIQDRASQAREKLATIKGYLFLAAKTGEPQPRLLSEVRLLTFNLKALSQLEYVDRFLDPPDIGTLKRTVVAIEESLLPHIKANDQLDEALQSISNFETDVFRISGATLAHSLTLRATAAIEANAVRNKLFFAVAILVSSIAVLFILQQGLLLRRKDHHIRSFSSLFAHMTRTRIAALRLFLSYLAIGRSPPSEMVNAARNTIAELESINEGLMTIAHAKSKSRSVPLRTLVENIDIQCPIKPQWDIDPMAGSSRVPASQFHLLLDELVRNAVNAVSQKTEPLIFVKASVRRRLLRGPQLILIVSDNGIGMNAKTLARAKEPFFSTKAGAHVGLGLTNCVEMVKTMAGTFKITSVPGTGTTVRITYSL
jgi:signal transduction histidine kinase